MKKIVIGLGVALVVLVLSCSSKKTVAPLSSSQKAQVMEAIGTLGRAFDSISARESSFDILGLRDETTLSKFKTLMTERLRKSDCPKKYKNSGQDNPVSPRYLDQNFEVLVAGDTCPVSLQSTGRMVPNADKVDGFWDIDYVIKEAEYRQWNDIQGISFHGAGELKKGSHPDYTSYDGGGMGNGTIKSLKYGDIPISVTLQAHGLYTDQKESGEVKLVVSAKYPDFPVELKVDGIFGNNTVVYTLNGDSLSSEEVEKAFEEIR